MIKNFVLPIFLLVLTAFSNVLCADENALDDMTLIKEGKLGTTFSDEVFHQNICGTGIECQLARGQNKDKANKLYISCDASKHTSKKFVIADLYFVPINGLESITVQTKSGLNISEKLTEGWRENRINTLRAIYELGDRYCEYGYSTFYVNGILKADRVPCKETMDFSNFRISFNGVNKAELLQMYLSRYKFYSADFNPYGSVYPIIQSGGKTFLSDIFVENDAKVKDLIFENSAVKVYEDDTFEKLSDGESPLCEGNTAVVENENGVFTFDIKYARDDGLFINGVMDLSDESIFKNVKNAAAEIVYRDGVPSSLRLENKNNYSNAEYCFSIPFAEFFDGTELKMKVYSKNISGLQFMSNLGAEISNRAYVLNDGVILNKWNDVRLVFDKRSHTVEFYVNDKIISVKNFDKLGIDKSYDKLRLMMFGKAETSGYLKDAEVYFFLNDSQKGSGLKISDKAALSLSDLTLYAAEDVKVFQLSEIFDGDFVVCDGFGNTKKSGESVKSGDCVITESDGFKRFTVKKLEKDKLIQLDETSDKVVIIAFGGEEDFNFYQVNYSENGISDVRSEIIEKGKINRFTIEKGDGEIKTILWSTNLMPRGKMLEYPQR